MKNVHMEIDVLQIIKRKKFLESNTLLLISIINNRGGFAIVWLGIDLETNQTVAMK